VSRTWARLAGVTAVAALAAAGAQTVASAAEGAILGADSKQAIEGSYIVVLKDGASVRAEASEAKSEHDARITHTYKSALHGFSAKMSESEAKELAADPSVAYVEQDQVARISTDQLNPPNWGLDRIDQASLPLNQKYSYSTTASNVTAYILDTGIRTSHQDFGGRATWGTNTTGDGNNTDCQGHGTHVAGTVGGTAHGVAKGVKLVAVKVLGCAGTGSYAGIIQGIDWVTSNAVKPAVVNMSLGGGANTSLDDAVKRSIQAGITYAVAAGNSNANACNYSPARTPEAITVGATEVDDERPTDWPNGQGSNYGSCLDIFAPGEDIMSLSHSSDTGTKLNSGTSMASPHVAGAAALYLAGNTSATPQQVRDALVNAGVTGKVTNPGTGSPNVLLQTTSGGTTPPPDPTGCTGTNTTNVNIPDAGSAVTSSITISGCNRNASSTSKIAVDIKHTWRGDLVVDLITPGGTVINLKPSSSSDSADNVITTYTKNLSTYSADGTWKLRVRDVYSWDTGYIDSWSFTG
jgi:subtilisin family serine protease